jgi:hypothetical protein
MVDAHRRSDDDLDAFVKAEIQEGRRVRTISPHRVLLTATVVFALGWLATDWIDEVRYHFSGQPLVELGAVDATEGVSLPAIGSYVRLQGVLGNKAASIQGLRPGSLRRGPVQVRQLMGSPIYVEFDEDALYGKYQPFTRIHVEGRVADFGPNSDLRRVREYFAQNLRMELPHDARVLIVGEKPGDLWQYVVALSVSLLLSIVSVVALIRSARRRVVDDVAT